MREMGYYIFFIHSEFEHGFGDFKATQAPWEARRAGLPRTSPVWHPACSLHPAVAVSTQPAPGVPAGGRIMPTPALAPMLLVPAQPSSQRHLPHGGPSFPLLFSIYWTAWLCKHMGTISRVVTPPWDCCVCTRGSPSALMLQKRVQLCTPTRSIMAPQTHVPLEIVLGGGQACF